MRSTGSSAILVVDADGCGELTQALRACLREVEWACTLGHACCRLNLRPFRGVAVGGAHSDGELRAFLRCLAESGITVPLFVLHDRQALAPNLPACVTCSPRSDWRRAVRAWADAVARSAGT